MFVVVVLDASEPKKRQYPDEEARFGSEGEFLTSLRYLDVAYEVEFVKNPTDVQAYLIIG